MQPRPPRKSPRALPSRFRNCPRAPSPCTLPPKRAIPLTRRGALISKPQSSAIAFASHIGVGISTRTVPTAYTVLSPYLVATLRENSRTESTDRCASYPFCRIPAERSHPSLRSVMRTRISAAVVGLWSCSSPPSCELPALLDTCASTSMPAARSHSWSLRIRCIYEFRILVTRSLRTFWHPANSSTFIPGHQSASWRTRLAGRFQSPSSVPVAILTSWMFVSVRNAATPRSQRLCIVQSWIDCSPDPHPDRSVWLHHMNCRGVVNAW